MDTDHRDCEHLAADKRQRKEMIQIMNHFFFEEEQLFRRRTTFEAAQKSQGLGRFMNMKNMNETGVRILW